MKKKNKGRYKLTIFELEKLFNASNSVIVNQCNKVYKDNDFLVPQNDCIDNILKDICCEQGYGEYIAQVKDKINKETLVYKISVKKYK